MTRYYVCNDQAKTQLYNKQYLYVYYEERTFLNKEKIVGYQFDDSIRSTILVKDLEDEELLLIKLKGFLIAEVSTDVFTEFLLCALNCENWKVNGVTFDWHRTNSNNEALP